MINCLSSSVNTLFKSSDYNTGPIPSSIIDFGIVCSGDNILYLSYKFLISSQASLIPDINLQHFQLIYFFFQFQFLVL